MSYLFTIAGEERMFCSTQPITGYPFTFAAWVKVANGSNSTIGGLYDQSHYGSSNAVLYASMAETGDWGYWSNRFDETTKNSTSISPLVSIPTTWVLLTGVCASATSRLFYIGATACTENTENLAWPTSYVIDSVNLGSVFGENGLGLEGHLAHVCIWNTNLSAEQVTSLAGGANPTTIAAANLVAYWPLTEDLTAHIGAYALTNNPAATLETDDNPTVDAETSPVTCDPGAGNLTLAGVASTLALTIAMATGSVAIAGQTSNDFGAEYRAPTVGSLAISGQTPAAYQAHYAAPGTAALAVAGSTADSQPDWPAAPGTCSVVITGSDNTVSIEVYNDTGELVLAGIAPTLNTTITPASAALTVAGIAPRVEARPATAAVVIAGGDTSLRYDYKKFPLTGSASFAGTEAGSSTSRIFYPGIDELVIAGTAPSIRTWMDPQTLTTTVGAIDSGSLQDVYTQNDEELVLIETAGTPGFDYRFGFTEVPSGSTYTLYFHGRYSGTFGDIVKFQRWNGGTLSWENLTDSTTDLLTSESNYTVRLPIYASGTTVSVRIVHSSAGTVGHTLTIDKLVLSTYQSEAPLTASLAIAGAAPFPLQNHLRYPGSAALVTSCGDTATQEDHFKYPTTGALVVEGSVTYIAGNEVAYPSTGSLTLGYPDTIVRLLNDGLPEVGTVTIAGAAPTRLVNVLKYPTIGAVVVSGSAPYDIVNHIISPSTGAATFAGKTPAALIPEAPGGVVGALVIEGSTPSLFQEHRPVQSTVALAIVGSTPSLFREFNPAPTTGSLTFASEAPFHVTNWPLTTSVGEVVIAGAEPLRISNHIAAVGTGALVTDPQLLVIVDEGTKVMPTVSVVIASEAPYPQQDKVHYPLSGSLTITGNDFVANRHDFISPATAAVVVGGVAPRSVPSEVAKPTTGALTIGATTATHLQYNIKAFPQTGALTVTGILPQRSDILLLQTGALVINQGGGDAPFLSNQFKIVRIPKRFRNLAIYVSG